MTNQAGIAKGIFQEKDFIKLHIYLKKYFFKKRIFFNDVQFCPFTMKKGKSKDLEKKLI